MIMATMNIRTGIIIVMLMVLTYNTIWVAKTFKYVIYDDKWFQSVPNLNGGHQPTNTFYCCTLYSTMQREDTNHSGQPFYMVLFLPQYYIGGLFYCCTMQREETNPSGQPFYMVLFMSLYYILEVDYSTAATM